MVVLDRFRIHSMGSFMEPGNLTDKVSDLRWFPETFLTKSRTITEPQETLLTMSGAIAEPQETFLTMSGTIAEPRF